VGTAEHTDALTRRIEQLAAAALDEGDGAALAALIAALRSEIGAVRVDVGSLRSEAGGLRTDLDGLEERVVASVDAGQRETTSLLRRFADELDETVTGALDASAQATAATGSTLEDARGVLESRLAVLEDAVDGLSERLESLARDGATTTTARLHELDTTVRELDARLSAQGARTAELVGDRLGAMSAVLERTLSALQATVGEQSAGVAALTGRFAGVGDELAGRVAELTTVVDERTGTLRTDVTERMAELEAAMSAFRTEWPTRTFEVVEGARAVAEGITREVRTEVGAQLDRVRAELARSVEQVTHAREGLDAQSTRLAEAGRVLVGYLEQRDRLLESERDRVLHDVLDSFATGLSSRERTALAGRMGDAVARRRDARDAERYRASLTGSAPDAPGPGLPPELALVEVEDVVRALSGRGPEEAPGDPWAGPPDEPQPTSPEPLRSVRAPSAAGPPGAPGDGRGRLSVMPEVPSVDVALDLGDLVPPAPAGVVPEPVEAPGELASEQQPPPSQPPEEDDDGVRRLFWRRPRP